MRKRRSERLVKYTSKDIERFREHIGYAMDYADDAGDTKVVEVCDEALDFLVYAQNIIEGEI